MKHARRTKGIASLVQPISLETFLDDYWPHRPLVTHGPLARVRAVAACPQLADLHTMLQARRRSSRIWVKDPRTGAHRAVLVTPAQAEDLYASEALTVSLDQIEIPEVTRLLADMASDLRVPAARLSCNVYVSPGGKGTTALHFDNHEVFAVQLRGRKRWQFAPNTHVPSPLEDYAVGTQASAALRRMCAGEFPDHLPARARTVVLVPGSVLFLPKGYWHLTHALEASVHLTLAVDSLAWVDVVMGQVRDRLVRDEGWRRTPRVLRGRGPRQEKTRQELSTLLGGLARELGALDAGRLTQSPYSPAEARPSS